MRFIEFEEIDSTNLEARRQADNGVTGPLWILAEKQTLGRGRRGREWTSVFGNLYCTGLYPHFGDARQAAQISFIAAIALAETIAVYVPKKRITLKWPNDVLIDGKKTAGILLESGSSHAKPWFIVGIGLNLMSHPDGTDYPATHVMDHMNPSVLNTPEPPVPTPKATLAILAERFDHWRHILVTEGFGPIREAWTEKAQGIPGDVTVRLPNETFTGMAMGLGPNGELQVRLGNGTIRDIHAGDVFFGLNG